MGTTLTYVYYVAGLLLASLPIGIEFLIRKKGAPRKPRWYMVSIVFLIVFLLSVGGYKINLDKLEKTHNDSLQTANKIKIDTLNANVASIKRYFALVKDSDRQFEDILLKQFKIRRNYNSNQPIYIGNIDNRHTNNTNIKKAENVDIH